MTTPTNPSRKLTVRAARKGEGCGPIVVPQGRAQRIVVVREYVKSATLPLGTVYLLPLHVLNRGERHQKWQVGRIGEKFVFAEAYSCFVARIIARTLARRPPTCF